MTTRTDPSRDLTGAGIAAGFLARAALFIAIGLALYILLLILAERQVRATGERNPLFQITALAPDSDVLVLGASHAMPLGFEGIGAALDEASGRTVTTLAIEGGGIVPAAFLLDTALRRTRPQTVVYVVDSFAFLSRQWNEDRLNDQELFARAPFDGDVLFAAVADAAARPVLPWYLSGFDKVNRLLWPAPDRSEAELTKFDRTYRENPRIDDQRVAYLFPDAPAELTGRYLARLDAMIGAAQDAGAEVVLLLMPAPTRYRDRLPPAHDAVMAGVAEIAAQRGVTIADHSGLLQADENYYDTDHLNRTGATAYVSGPLAELLERPDPEGAAGP